MKQLNSLITSLTLINMKWSKYQEAIFDAYTNTRSNIAIEASAGASKTTVIVECCKRTPPHLKVLFMAFNKSIAEELKTKLPKNVDVGTFHSKGLSTLLSNFRFKMKLSETKCFKLALQILDTREIPSKQVTRYLFELQDVWASLRSSLLVGEPSEIEAICFEKELEYRERMVKDIQLINDEWNSRASKINSNKEYVLDFTDMLYLPYILLDPQDFPKYDVVFIDEAQDISTLQRELILSFVKPKGGRLISVGDRNQTIYSFQNASVSNFLSLQGLSNTTILPLNLSYRCAKRIVEEANKVFPNSIEALETAPEGIVRNGSFTEARSGDFILCRNNMPLVDVFISFLKKKQKASIKGKDFGEALKALIDKVNDIDQLDEILKKKLDSLLARRMSYSAAINNPSYVNLVEKCQIIERLYTIWSDMDLLKQHISEIFTEKTEGIVLSTIHKSKGLEAERVFFLDPNLIPSQHAKTEEAFYSEKCLRFVAITRAKKELIYCNSNDYER